MVAEIQPKIRAGTSTDLAACKRLDPQFATDLRRELLFLTAVESHDALVAVSGSEVLGYLLLTHHFFGRSFIELLIVDPLHHRRGVGRQLIQASFERVHGEDVFTSTNASNAPMIALLEHLGFVRSGIIHNLDPGDPELVWYKPLRSS